MHFHWVFKWCVTYCSHSKVGYTTDGPDIVWDIVFLLISGAHCHLLNISCTSLCTASKVYRDPYVTSIQTLFCCDNSLHSSGKAFNKILESLAAGIYSHSTTRALTPNVCISALSWLTEVTCCHSNHWTFGSISFVALSNNRDQSMCFFFRDDTDIEYDNHKETNN